ncbi:MAG: hypothetical protein KBT27_11345 [Prevotellaceae bacterium]|nr:hypothetical protein [Candidatus Faecinaster equi]
MKYIISFVLILIGYFATTIGATKINEWFGLFVCGLWSVAIGIVVAKSSNTDDEDKPHTLFRYHSQTQ